MNELKEKLGKYNNRIVIQDGCWPWIGAKHSAGYGRIMVNGRLHTAHRVIYQLLVGPIPDGMVVDHLCRNRICVNPAHMEVVSNKTNVLRGVGLTAANITKTHCLRGHEYSPENTYVNRGRRHCRACLRAKWHERKDRCR